MASYTVIAGPNGAGKTTLGDRLEERGYDLGRRIDPDRIARESGASSAEAGRVALAEIRSALEEGRSFTQETTLSSRQPLRTLKEAREAGFRTTVIFVGVNDVETSIGRVQLRVALGGHDIPEADQRRRFERTFAHAVEAARVADVTTVIDNSDPEPRAVLQIGEGRVTELRADAPEWARRLAGALGHERSDQELDRDAGGGRKEAQDDYRSTRGPRGRGDGHGLE